MITFITFNLFLQICRPVCICVYISLYVYICVCACVCICVCVVCVCSYTYIHLRGDHGGLFWIYSLDIPHSTFSCRVLHWTCSSSDPLEELASRIHGSTCFPFPAYTVWGHTLPHLAVFVSARNLNSSSYGYAASTLLTNLPTSSLFLLLMPLFFALALWFWPEYIVCSNFLLIVRFNYCFFYFCEFLLYII